MHRFRTIAPLVAVLALLAATPAQASTSYRVRWGDTLTWIAEDHDISLTRLAHVNGIDPYGVLVEGTVLRIPLPRLHHAHATVRAEHPHRRSRPTYRYTVQWGDTLTAIAARNGTTLLRLAELNRLDPYGVLLAGAVLRVPGAERHASRPATGQPTVRRRHHRPRPAGPWSVQGSIDHWAAHYGVDPH